ncbi:MAG TPA: hypothetical protein VKZ43_05480 [Trueperaceae bacterium]|nr:hypothetical protein [Trueperaceae bacterium]
MGIEPKKVTPSPATGATKSSTSPVPKGADMPQVTLSTNRLRAKLLRSIFLIAALAATLATAKDIEFERGSDAAAARRATVVHVGLNSAGFRCSVDSAYGPDFLWTRWFGNALLRIDPAGAASLVLFDDEGGRETRCEAEASVEVSGAIDIEFSQTSAVAQYLVKATGASMGYVRMTADEMIARIVSGTEVVTAR